MLPRRLAVLALAASASALQLGPIGAVHRTALGRTPAVSLCDPLMVGGVPVGVDDAVVCRDEESQAWWRGTIRETKGTQLRVHYMGCDDDWDAWFEASSPDIVAMDAQEASRGAFQSEDVESALAAMDDESILETYRQEKWDVNARWQLATFAQSQLGKWAGALVSYEPSLASDGVFKMVEGGTHATTSHALVMKDGEIEWHEALHDERLATTRILRPASFDRERGSNCVGNGYSFTAGTGAEGEAAGADGSLLFELGLRDADQRLRVKFAYTRQSSGDHAIERIAIVREAETTMPAGTPQQVPPGGGLYDPPPGDRTDYCSLYCDGGITLVFPVRLDAEERGFVSVRLPLAFTRDSFTSKLYCGSLSFLCCPLQTCNACPVAILVHGHCAIYAPPPTLPLYAIHHTLLVMAISLCKGSQQGGIIRGQHLSSYTQQVPTPCESAPTTTEPSVRNLFSVAAAMLRFIVTPPADYPCTEGWLRTTIPFLKRATPPPVCVYRT